ncbi:MAG: DNA methyltransferase [Novosphingobium sp.]
MLRRKIASDSVDLCYIDPPFNSKRNYFQIYNNQGGEDRAQAQAFVDTWEWGDEAVEGLAWITDITQLQSGKLTEQTVELIRGLEKVLKHGALLAYLIHMTLRIVEIHRVLKTTGSFFLHCDPTASHYLKLVLDSVFCGQGGDFKNEIIWCYNVGGKSKKWFARKHDVIFWYTKSDQYFFDGTLAGMERETGTKSFGGKLGVDEDGRRYQDKLVKSSGKYYRYYLDYPKIPEDWWVDINSIQSQSAERMGYPTQKPELLLERIIKTASTDDGVILDAYCGCGTTIAVAQRLNRKWIGIDITYQSIALILKRLEDQHPADWPAIEANILLDGVPRDLASAVALANRKDDKTRKEFEKWAILTYSKNQARINEKKGADGGIDGIAFFIIDSYVAGGANNNGKAVFQVKSGKTGRGDLAKLNSDRMRENAEFGFLIAMDTPTKAMRDEIAAAGKYRHPALNREDDRIQVITVEEILGGKRLDLPMARPDAVKSAAAIGDADKQETLF